jgi:AraC-like DNA-binding protein
LGFKYGVDILNGKMQTNEEPLYGLWSRHGDPLLMQFPRRHNELELNLLERGSIQYLFSGQRVEIQHGQLFLFWAGVPHQLVWKTNDAYIHWLTFPLAWLLRWRLSEDFIQSLFKGLPVINADASSQAADLAAFYRWHADLVIGLDERKEVMLLELEARARRLNLEWAESVNRVRTQRINKKAGPSDSLGKAEKIAQYLSANFMHEWSPEEAAKVVGLHPNYAMGLFQRAFGISMVGYVTQLRVALAQKLLVTSSKEILILAQECGFGSTSRFYAAFKDITATTPYRYRRSMHRSK